LFFLSLKIVEKRSLRGCVIQETMVRIKHNIMTTQKRTIKLWQHEVSQTISRQHQAQIERIG